jgi:hypothetical protein
MFAHVTREDLAEDLWEYGEDELSERALGLSDADLARIGELAGLMLVSDEHATASGASPTFGKAGALAAVEVLDRKRPLRRKRRRIRARGDDSWLLPEDWEPPPEHEDARDVFLEACAAVASQFANLGFRFAKSGPHMTRRAGDFTFVVGFGWRAYWLDVHAGVRSARLRSWRRDGPCDLSDYIATAQLGNLREPSTLLDWNLSAASHRTARVAEIVEAIHEIAVPYFAEFEDELSLVERLMKGGFLRCEGLAPVEWLLATNRREAAEEHGVAVLSRYSWARRGFDDKMRQYVRSGLDPLSDLEQDLGLAHAAIAYGLEFNA